MNMNIPISFTSISSSNLNRVMKVIMKCFFSFPWAMYKTRNTGTGNGMRGMGGMLYSVECHQTFQGMSPNILGNVVKHFKIIWGML